MMLLQKKYQNTYGKSNSLIYQADKIGINIPHDIELSQIEQEIRDL